MAAIVFDLDGVLVDSEPSWQQGFLDVTMDHFEERGWPAPPLTRESMARFQGGRVSDTMRTIVESQGRQVGPATVERLTSRVVEHVSQRFDAADAIKESVETAHALAARGHRLAVASSSAQEFIGAALAAIGLADDVEVTQSALRLERGKPFPDVYELTLEQLGVTASQAVAVEDSTTGLGAAVRAGMATVWLLLDSAETDEEALQRLRETLGDDAELACHVRRISRHLSVDDVEDVVAQL